jgi:hypothetical protein
VATTDERGGSLETVHEIPVDGDDIVVVPGGTGDPLGPSRRNIVAGAGIVAILVIIAVVALVARHSGSTTRVRTTSPTTLAPVPIVANGKPTPSAPKKSGPPIAVATVENTSAPTTVAVAVPPVTAAAQTSPPTPVPPPKQYGPSVLTWDAPRSLAIATGKTKTLSVAAHNPSDGTVTLPHPLSCAPRLDHGEICPEMVQQIGSGQSASARYTIDATGIAKGTYTLKIEGVLTVQVTVS